MKAVVVYESMYGNTHLIADAVAEGLRDHGEAVVVPVGRADRSVLQGADVVVVGGPTHVHGMSRPATRKGAVAAAEKGGLNVEPDAMGAGLREWFDQLGWVVTSGAAFDTRFQMPAALTGRASKRIARELHHHGAKLVCDPESFFVTKRDTLEPDEQARAREWGARLGLTVGTLVA